MMRTALLVALTALLCSASIAQQTIKYPTVDPSGTSIEISATLTSPKQPLPAGSRGAAVVLLHSGGGWESPVTEQYAKALSDAGFTVMEPKLFQNQASAPTIPPSILPMVYDALRYLSTRDDVDSKRVGIAGFSYGGGLSLHSAAAWAQVAYAKSPELRFAAHAPFYPVCWAFSAFAQGKRKNPILPADAFTKWTGAPVKIFAGGMDDYDDKDPNACSEFVSYIPASHQQAFSVQLYPEATHGWDQRSATFHERLACKGRGCTNRNESNPEVTKQSISDLVDFFRKTLVMAQ